MGQLTGLDDIKDIKIGKERDLHSATHDEILSGATTDVYFLRTMDILRHMNLNDQNVTAEIFARRPGILAGVEEVKNILKNKNLEIWAMEEGESFEAKETILRIKGPYDEFGILETAILGSLASASGWATAAKEIREACGDKPFICFGARHVHPAVAPVMERAAVIGGANGASCVLAAKLMGIEPSGTVPHAPILIAGDTLEVSMAYNQIMPKDHKRIVLVDTFKDEIEESLRIAEALGKDLFAIRLDTPSERGGVTPFLVKELRAKLDLNGYHWVKIFVSGGLTPEKIRILSEAGADSFGVGSYISGAPAIDMTMDIKCIGEKPVAKRGRIPGLIENKKLKKIV